MTQMDELAGLFDRMGVRFQINPTEEPAPQNHRGKSRWCIELGRGEFGKVNGGVDFHFDASGTFLGHEVG